MSVITTNLTWQDASRQRDLLVRLYAPSAPVGRCPLIVFSHGLGGTRTGYQYFGQSLAGQGYMVVHVQHPGTDDGIFHGSGTPREKALRAVANLEHTHHRPQDVSFVIDRLLSDARVDPEAVGVAGHSLGAHTALAVAGMTIEDRSHHDPRVRAIVVMSPPRPPKHGALQAVNLPCLHLTGTDDESPLFPHITIDRDYCFHHAASPDQWLVVLRGAHHFTFADNPVWAGRRVVRDPRHQPWVTELSGRFFDAFLRGDPAAKSWLTDGGMTKLLGDDAEVESK